MPATPLLSFDEAEHVGQRLHDHWQRISGTAPMAREDLAWADVVQLILREAGVVVSQREGVEA